MNILILFALAFSPASALRPHNLKLGIAKGKKATVGQFPYQVGLEYIFVSNMNGWCGGSLIGNQWVLTAAHCNRDVKSVTVLLGATERNKAEIKYTVSSSDIINHADWDSKTINNDIALINIPHTAYTAKIQQVKLPAISITYSTYVGHKAVVSGWGLISDSATSLSNDLQWASLKVITNDACAKSYSDIISAKLCVSTPGGIAPCEGDSGGPLVLESSLVQIGVDSAGDTKGCAKGEPEAFTRVTSYLGWIKAKTGISY